MNLGFKIDNYSILRLSFALKIHLSRLSQVLMRYLQEQATLVVDRFEASARPSLRPSAYSRAPTKLLSLAYLRLTLDALHT